MKLFPQHIGGSHSSPFIAGTVALPISAPEGFISNSCSHHVFSILDTWPCLMQELLLEQHKPRIWENWDLFPTFAEERDMSQALFPGRGL